MRLRNIKGAGEVLAASEYMVHAPETFKGNWKQIFLNDHPIHIEIGMGKGKFIIDLAQRNPDINYLGIERYSSVLIRGIQKRKEIELPNLYFIHMDANKLTEIFGPGEISRIYLNFSDPWPKDRHEKRRLTSENFLACYKQILREKGQIEFKTDNRALFDFSLKSVDREGWKIETKTYDLHHSHMAVGNVMTEYESKFVEEGKAICKLIAVNL